MVRKKGYIPKHCRHKHKNLGFVCLNGRTLYTGPWGSPEAESEYERLIAEWLFNGRQLPRRLTGEDSYLVKHLVADFWRWAESHYRKGDEPSREINNIRDAMNPLLDLYGHTEADEFGPLALSALREHIVDQGRWARTTVNSRINIIRRVFKWGTANEKVPARVYEGIRSLPGLQRGRTTAREPDPILPVIEADMRAVLPHVAPQAAIRRDAPLLHLRAWIRSGEEHTGTLRLRTTACTGSTQLRPRPPVLLQVRQPCKRGQLVPVSLNTPTQLRTDGSRGSEYRAVQVQRRGFVWKNERGSP